MLEVLQNLKQEVYGKQINNPSCLIYCPWIGIRSMSSKTLADFERPPLCLYFIFLFMPILKQMNYHDVEMKVQVKFPKLYRLLHESEDTCISNGLFAKSPGAGKDVATHVTTGSQRDHSSQYISTCSSLCNAELFRSLKLNSGYKWCMKHIVEIDVGSLPDDVEIIDLRTRILRRKYEVTDKEINERFHKFADDHKEVLLVGTVPASCLKLKEFTGIVPDSDTSCSDQDDILSDNLEFNGYDFNSSNSDSDC
ncbi:unnamed protein product [Mytilus edulis]|uniref:Uncharacterized protein n=1 Tax=Mytilus edulis TaxID=6550 RepID=A0A8S3V387_MYTED|nr:unnamed protein product [Mytilus edulis]